MKSYLERGNKMLGVAFCAILLTLPARAQNRAREKNDTSRINQYAFTVQQAIE